MILTKADVSLFCDDQRDFFSIILMRCAGFYLFGENWNPSAASLALYKAYQFDPTNNVELYALLDELRIPHLSNTDFVQECLQIWHKRKERCPESSYKC
jgi:hypothetical protein